MSLKERHYDRKLAPIRRDLGDVSPRLENLTAHLDHQFYARIFLPHLTSPSSPSLISSAQGSIDRILLTIPTYAVSEPVMRASYESLLQSLPSHTKLVILVQEAAKQIVDGWVNQYGFQQRVELATFPDTLNISIWAEDGYVVAEDGGSGNTYFVEPYAFPRYADGLVADYVSNFTNLHDTQAPLYFQGGNTLIGDDFMLIGADYPAKTLQYINSGVLSPPAGVPNVDFVKSLYSKYLDSSRSILYVGSRKPVPSQRSQPVTVNGEQWHEVLYAGNDAKGTVQPLFHIDMFVTLAGREANGYRVLVGDPGLAFSTLGQAPLLHAMQDVFDDIAAQFSSSGFLVTRNPLPLVYMDDTQAKERMWYFATANNALVEVSTSKNVWLPTYGHGIWPELAATDAANKSIWEGLGYTTHMLGDFHPFAENLGAVHCIKKYLARGSIAAPMV